MQPNAHFVIGVTLQDWQAESWVFVFHRNLLGEDSAEVAVPRTEVISVATKPSQTMPEGVFYGSVRLSVLFEDFSGEKQAARKCSCPASVCIGNKRNMNCSFYNSAACAAYELSKFNWI
jgi:hypothetical protein